jgi:ethanolamine-phosphate cytidylyltransferase
MLHNRHLEFLRKAKEHGDFMYVGVYDDETSNLIKGKNFPIITLNERVLMLLACRYVDDVIIGAPYHLSGDLIKTLNI